MGRKMTDDQQQQPQQTQEVRQVEQSQEQPPEQLQTMYELAKSFVEYMNQNYNAQLFGTLDSTWIYILVKRKEGGPK